MTTHCSARKHKERESLPSEMDGKAAQDLTDKIMAAFQLGMMPLAPLSAPPPAGEMILILPSLLGPPHLV